MGGLVGGSTSAECIIENCTNSGNVISHLGCRTGGFVGHNAGTIRTCKNTGAIIGQRDRRRFGLSRSRMGLRL